ncbi:MAG: hypothetical protein RMX57_01170 [Planktomarina sp.]|jgi:hypothetical protein|nr:hypothetical protein [Planktomarina sp.]|tara:strand:- start:98 stop:373 length:276 start_codon:yes stop_codon:yes gene_type:complete
MGVALLVTAFHSEVSIATSGPCRVAATTKPLDGTPMAAEYMIGPRVDLSITSLFYKGFLSNLVTHIPLSMSFLFIRQLVAKTLVQKPTDNL